MAEKLERISAKTIDRLLGRERQVGHLARHCNRRVHPLLYQKIPVKTAGDWDRQQVGKRELDCVVHGGRSSGGEYIRALSAAEIATGWWEGEAIAGGSQQATRP